MLMGEYPVTQGSARPVRRYRGVVKEGRRDAALLLRGGLFTHRANGG